MTSTEHLTAERRQRRMTNIRRCVAIAISAKTDALTAGLIDDAVRLASLESRFDSSKNG